MLRTNGGLIGKRRLPNLVQSGGVWSLAEQATAKRENVWPGSNDPYFSNVSLLMHMDGINNSTQFTDSSSYAHPVTINNSPRISTDQSVFGGSSAYFDGISAAMYCPTTSGAFNFSTVPFTIEAWLYLPNLTGNRTIAAIWPTNNGASWRFRTAGSSLVFSVKNNVDFVSDSCLVANSWCHVAMVRVDRTYSFYCNSAFVGSGYLSPGTSDGVINNAQGNLWIGVNEASYVFLMSGYMDELRITKNVARYTGSTYEVPTSPFPNG